MSIIRKNIFQKLSVGSKLITMDEKPARHKIKHIFKKNSGDIVKIFEKNLMAVNGTLTFSSNKLSLCNELKNFYQKSQFKEILTYETDIQKILSEASIPYSSLPENMSHAEASATGCEYLIARLGTILVSSTQTKSRKIICFPPAHIVIAPISKLVYDLTDALELLNKKYDQTNFPSMLSLITGPSRTADIEKTLILGAHGPKNLFVFLYNDN